MFDRHTLCHGVLTAIYSVTGVVLLQEGTLAHAICAFAAAFVYATLTHGAAHRDQDNEYHRPATEETQECEAPRTTEAE